MRKLWNNKEYKLLQELLITDQIIEKYINLFWKDVISQISESEHILLIFRVKFENNQIATLSTTQRINKSNKDDLILFIKDRTAIANEAYKTIPIQSFIFSYGIREGEYTPTLGNKPPKDIKYQIYYRNELPIAVLPKDYGIILSEINNVYTISVNRGKKSAIIILTIKKTDNETVNYIKYFKNNNLLFNWTDTIVSLQENKFIRRIGKSIIHFENGELSLYTTIKKTSPILPKKLPKNNQLNNKFITMDLETVTINNILIPYLLCWYDGRKTYSYFITPPAEIKDLDLISKDNLDSYILSMVGDAMKDICKRKYKNYRIYLHNFAKFDGYFLIKYLAQLGYCDPIIHKGKIISCKFYLYETNILVTFMDSYLILTSSLKKLCESFNIDPLRAKGIFPFKLNDINYKGNIPDHNLFEGVTLEDYDNYKESYKNKIWDFKEEAIKYCNLDCISLYQILVKFNQLIFSLSLKRRDKFKLNITKYPTLPSLAFAIFKNKNLKKDTIHMLSGKVAEDIRRAYTGGSVDMYKPMGKNIHVYDVNSLYPYVMKNNLYPIGPPTSFEGDILKLDKNAFGFFYCKITAPDNLLYPILQTHYNNRTVAPLGIWEGMYFSPELFNAKKYGYKFEIIWGYTFKKGEIFSGYINDLYNLRLSYPESDPMNLTAKLLLNSLYGRFGMDDYFTFTYIMSKKDYINFEKLPGAIDSIIDIVEMDNNFIIKVKNPIVKLKTLLDNGTETHNINIAIAAAVTAYARIHMSNFKNNPNYPNLYYSDTDSIYFDGALPNSIVDKERLGALKLEGVYDEAIFLAPKVYALKNQERRL